MKAFAVRIVAAMVLMVLAPAVLALTAQKISFGKLGNKTFGAAPFTVSAKASSGLPVSFASTTAGVCTVGGNTVTLVGAGKCTIRASQAGNATYAAAPNVNQSFTIAKGNQTINLVQPGDKPIGTPPFAVTASATSGLALTLVPITPSTCSASGGTVTILMLGSCAIRVMQAGNANYNAAPTVILSFTVVPIADAQTIAFAALSDRTLGTPPFTISATASSGLPVSFATLTAGVCTVSGSTVTLVAAGTCTIRASQPGDAIYAAAPNVDRGFTVAANVNVTIRYTHDAVGNLIGVQRVQ